MDGFDGFDWLTGLMWVEFIGWEERRMNHPESDKYFISDILSEIDVNWSEVLYFHDCKSMIER